MKTGLFIPTRGRVGQDHSFQRLPKEWAKRATVVCPDNELEEHEKYYRDKKSPIVPGFLTLPYELAKNGVAASRQYILDYCLCERIQCCIMMDDDTLFYVRKQIGDWHLRYTSPEEVGNLLSMLVSWIEHGFAHVGVSVRQGNNTVQEEVVFAARMFNLYAHNTSTLKLHKLRWDEVRLMEDFNMILQLLALGYPNAVSYNYAWGQSTSNAPGGCSIYRTPELQKETAEYLAKKFPGIVSVVEKETKTGWEGMQNRDGKTVRHDVRIAWKKALQQSGAELPSMVNYPDMRTI